MTHFVGARAVLRDEFDFGHMRLLVGVPRGDGMDVLLEDGSWQYLGPGEASPPAAGIVLPHEAVDAIAAALHPRAGHRVEVDRLVEALELERKRVDRVLDRALANGRTGGAS